ncbi:MAG: DUF1326 domain-containing protein [Acidobacteriota bacterium]|nr:DUF1326 domain-containing protein [Acidobacteriota bacterium]
MGASVRWWARGLLFENCSCTTVCPGHVHFKQACTHERCVGYWAIRFDEGEFDGESLAGTSAVIAYDSPQHMIEGGWIQTIIIDDGASETQRRAIETILTGVAGGPWEILGRFVGKRETTRHLPIVIRDHGKTKHVAVDGLLESTIEDIRGRDRSEPVTFENMFNQIHATSQVIATGGTRYDDGVIAIEIDGTHALHSRFDWSVEP